MQSVDGYTIEKCLSSTPRGSIYRARRDRDGCEVVLKSYAADPAGAAGSTAAREFEALRAIEPGFGIRAIELTSGDAGPVLVVEDFPGTAPRCLLEIPAFLDIAVRAARALGGVHRARWLHRNLAPDRLLVHAVTGELRLTGFERSAPLGAPADGAESRLDLPLLYAAPEQSGRTERGIDARSDLYALGAVLYELLTGLPPFDSTDPLELIQAHVARRPKSPLELRPEIPATLARILLRLLEKEPEDRYQTAEALAVDLETARDQLARTGRIDDEMPLATADMPYRPLFRRAVYGRERELHALRSAYRRAAQGGRQLLLVSGVPGVGKSALIPELYRPLAEDGGYLVQGKFDLYRRHVPYVGFSSAFNALAEQILSESEARVRAWRDTLSAALGSLSGVVADLGPPLRALLGETPPLPALGPSETQQRLALAVQRLIRSAAERAHPLVLFLDDLQWADAGSLYLLEEVLRLDSLGHLLMIGAYRQNEVDATHPFRRLLERLSTSTAVTALELAPLEATAATQMLADALACTPDRTRTLAANLERSSGNNPLLLQHCVYHLHHLGVIRFERGRGWQWDDAAVSAAALPEDPIAMMAAKLERLTRELREALQLASCVGDHFDLEWLLELSPFDRKSLEAALYTLCDEGLIAPAREGFRFVHDRIREAAQAQLSEGERAWLHAQAAEFLLAKTPPSELDARVLEIADHLILGREQLDEPARFRAIGIHLRAGQLALGAGAAASAARYFGAGEALSVESDWERAPDQSFALRMGFAEAAYQLRDLPRAEQLLDALKVHSLSFAQNIAVMIKQISLRSLTRDESALALTLSTLRKLGLHWPRNPSWLRVRLAILRTDWLLRSRIEACVFPNLAPGAEQSARNAIIGAGGAAMSWSSPGLLVLATAYLLRDIFRHGASGTPGYRLAAYSTYRMRFLSDLSHVERYARAAEAWLKRKPSIRARYNLTAFHDGWLEARVRTAESLVPTVEALAEIGDLQYRHYAAWDSLAYFASSGQTLERILRQFETLRPSMGPLCPPFLPRMFRALQQPDAQEISWLLETARAEPSLSGSMIWLHWTVVLCALGEYELAARHAATALELGSPTSNLADGFMVRGLGAAILAPRSAGRERRRARRVLRRCLRQLNAWVPYAPDVLHMRQLLVAELARLDGRTAPALRAYSECAQRARERGFRHHAALAHERRADLLEHLHREPEAAEALDETIQLYREWGAHARVHELELRRHPRAEDGSVD